MPVCPEWLGRVDIVRFDKTSAARFSGLPFGKIRVGTQDLKIASIALAQSAVVLTASSRDFEQVPDLRVENWLW